MLTKRSPVAHLCSLPSHLVPVLIAIYWDKRLFPYWGELRVSNSGFGSGVIRRLIYDLVDTWERLFGIRPSVETVIKIMKVEELLKRGATLREAIRSAGLGWKSFYKYALLMYLNDPDLLIPIPKHFLKQYTHVLSYETLAQTRVVLNEVAEYAALELAGELYREGKVKPDEFGKKWYTLAQDLLKTWIHELAEDILFGNMMQF
jgi:hypothetical protein